MRGGLDLSTDDYRTSPVSRRYCLRLSAATGIAALPFRLDAATAPIISRIQLTAGRVVMPLMIDGKGPYLFLLDTGGTMSLIDRTLAAELKLKVAGNAPYRGIGGSATLPIYLARDVVFGGGARQKVVGFAGMAHGFRRHVRGTLAAGVLTAVDTDLDFAAGEWRVYPDGRGDRSGFVRLTRAIQGATHGGRSSPRLFGNAQVDGRELDFLLDTGAPRALSLHIEAARKLGLWDDARPYAPFRTSGIGGAGDIGRLVRAESIDFGGVRFERPLVFLHGAKDRSGEDGIIGLEMLRRYTLSTDVRGRALWVKPYPDAARSTERYGLSGLWLVSENDAVTVEAVGTGSPAAKAGVQVGDRITNLPFDQAVAAITRGPGSRVDFTLLRAGQTIPASFELQLFL